MKIIAFTVFIMIIFIVSGCAKPTDTVNQKDYPIPTAVTEEQNTPNDLNEDNIYCFDAAKEWDAADYKNKYGMDFYYFSAPIQSPYKYSYQCVEDKSIDEIANELGNIMLKDFMRDYEGKTFTVTEYRNITAYIMNTNEFKDWEDRYSKLGKHIELNDNQWLCTFACEYKYTGVYSGIGEMPADLEWMNTLATDGSGENYVFIIQKENEEYIMRALPKTVMELKKQ
jgi:hypothetical protein